MALPIEPPEETIVYDMFVRVPRIKDQGCVWIGGYTDINLASEAIYNFCNNFKSNGTIIDNNMFSYTNAGEGEKITIKTCLQLLYQIKDQMNLHFFDNNHDYARILIRKEVKYHIYSKLPGKHNKKFLYLNMNVPISLNDYPGEKF